jgi:hypothetical protein
MSAARGAARTPRRADPSRASLRSAPWISVPPGGQPRHDLRGDVRRVTVLCCKNNARAADFNRTVRREDIGGGASTISMHSHARWLTLPITVAVVVIIALGGYGKKSLPSPWKELGFPLEGSALEPDARNDEKQMVLECDGITAINAFFEKHAKAFRNAGYAEKELTRDPVAGVIEHEFTKGTQVITFRMGGQKDKCYIMGTVRSPAAAPGSAKADRRP